MNKPSLGKDEINKVNYKEYLEKINQDLEKIKEIYADPLDGILKYDKKGICTTFFGEIEGNIDIEIIISKEKEIVDIVNKIDGIKSDLNNKLGIPPNLKELYIKSLESMKNKFLMFKNALWIEGEKSGYPLSNQERKKYSDKVLDLQKIIYGERVSDNVQEIKDIMNKLHDIFEKGRDKIGSGKKISTFTKYNNIKDFPFGIGKPVISSNGKIGIITDILQDGAIVEYKLGNNKKSAIFTKFDNISKLPFEKKQNVISSNGKIGIIIDILQDGAIVEYKLGNNKKSAIFTKFDNISKLPFEKKQNVISSNGKIGIIIDILQAGAIVEYKLGNNKKSAIFTKFDNISKLPFEKKQNVISADGKIGIITDILKDGAIVEYKLKEGEIEIFEDFLKKFDLKFGFDYIKQPGNKPKSKEENEIKNIDKDKLKQISKDIVNFYKNHFGEENTDLGKWNVIEQSGISSLNISGMKQEFRIPEDYENVDRKKITQTVASHEIEQHLLGWDNNNRVLGKGFTSGGYDFISEGVAKINEDIALGKVNSIEDLKKLKEGVSIGIIGVFVCENYTYEDAVKILTIYNKLSSKDDEEKCKKKAIDIVKRRKRFVPYNIPGSSIKDTLYQRGKNRVIDYLIEDGSLETAIKRYKDLNTFKFGPEELKYINEIKKELNVKDEELIYTLFIGRILHDKLNKGKGSTKEYLSEMNLNRKNIEFKTKRELVNILSQLKESKKENQSEYTAPQL